MNLICMNKKEAVNVISPIEDIIDEARAGRLTILVDDEDRENEGDLFVPAEAITPEMVNFMAMYGRGLICLTLEPSIADRLELPLMPKRNNASFDTAFTVSIEAAEGVTTGISAADRSHTIKTAIDPQSSPQNLATPGHIFPIRAAKDGVLARAGHTEATVDIAKLAGFQGAGVICEIMNHDGTMARLSELAVFAEKFGLKIGTIADLVAYQQKQKKAP
jgi:3,4-dihydroxy 2-butanone 4-phosphate synthase/GTP cyclohydrolase II